MLVIDQLTKALVRDSFVLQQTRPFIPHVLDLTYVSNVGAAFGLLPGQRPVFIGTSLLVLLVIAAYWRRSRPQEWPIVFGLGFVTAGALGNLVDRAFFGRVTDFFSFAFMDFPVFNIADTSIFVGVMLLMAWLLFGPEPERPLLDADPEGAAAAGPADSAPESPESRARDTSPTESWDTDVPDRSGPT